MKVRVKSIQFVITASFIIITIYINLRIYIDQYEPNARFSGQLDMFLKTRKDIAAFDINIDVKGEDEVVRLSKTFNMMVFKIRNLIEQILVEQEEKRRSELDALQAQINPHFLYNTLDSIVWTAESGEVKDASSINYGTGFCPVNFGFRMRPGS